MPRLPQAMRLVLHLAAAGLLAAACRDPNPRAFFDPDKGHAPGWDLDHGPAYLSDTGSCGGCHGGDLTGGISLVSCFSAAFGGTACHPGGPGTAGHAAGFGDPTRHGPAAKAAPGAGAGFASCRACHGAAFAGGPAVSCFGCHGVAAPHAPSPWRGVYTHTDAAPGNAPVCGDCHHRAGASGPSGCFNDTLCHGEQD